jgi:hypothetical protein
MGEKGEAVQTTTSAASGQAFETSPIIATVIGIPAVAIVVAALNGASLPLIGSGVGAVVGLWFLATLMCARGIAAMKGRFGLRSFLIGGPLGIIATALILSGIFGWSLLLQPIANAMGPSVSLQRAAIVGVGAIMIVKWAIAWTSYLPRSD